MRGLLFFILSMLLFSCSEEKGGQGLALIKDAWKMAVFRNETLVTGVLGELEAERMTHADSLVKADVERIVSWRRGFASEPTLGNLLRLSDSVEHAQKERSPWGSDFSAPVRELREQMESSPDSVAFYSLLYYAAAGEGALLQRKASERGAVEPASWRVPSYLDKSRYREGDTVFLTVSTAGFHSGGPALDFSQVTCRNTESGATLEPRIIRSGPHYILMYTPDAQGAYEITGGFGNRREDNFGYALRIRNRFEVSPTAADRG